MNEGNRRMAQARLELLNKNGFSIFHSNTLKIASIDKNNKTVKSFSKQDLNDIYVFQYDNNLSFDEAIAYFFYKS